MSRLDLRTRADEYARQQGMQLADHLGGGTDGEVWMTNRRTAVKVFQYRKNYDMEVACYHRRKERGVTRIGHFAVPRLVQFDEPLMIVEIEIVTPPYVIDFGKAYLDGEPEHSAETWAEHQAAQRELWEDKFNEVQSVLR